MHFMHIERVLQNGRRNYIINRYFIVTKIINSMLRIYIIRYVIISMIKKDIFSIYNASRRRRIKTRRRSRGRIRIETVRAKKREALRIHIRGRHYECRARCIFWGHRCINDSGGRRSRRTFMIMMRRVFRVYIIE